MENQSENPSITAQEKQFVLNKLLQNLDKIIDCKAVMKLHSRDVLIINTTFKTAVPSYIGITTVAIRKYFLVPVQAYVSLRNFFHMEQEDPKWRLYSTTALLKYSN